MDDPALVVQHVYSEPLVAALPERHPLAAQRRISTRTRIDMGFGLKDTRPTGRLIDTGGFAKKDRITHRIPIASLAEVDGEVKRWMKVAYEMDAAK